MRLDIYLASCGYCQSRSEAQRAIHEGRVYINGKVCTRASEQISDDMDVKLISSDVRFVSRGGQKLHAALSTFGISVNGCVALDIGASTGGFTDCLLQNGAKLVYALENGCGQLHESLLKRTDVVNMEHTNARYLKKDMFSDAIGVVTMDVSFISQTLILPAIAEVLSCGGILVSLIKPQFEVGRAHVGKGGIVRDARARDNAVRDVCAFAESLGFRIMGLTESPIKGGDGNTEYLAYFIYEGGVIE